MLAKMNIKRMPIKKVGSEKVVRDDVTQKLSRPDPLLLETSIPRRIPTRIDITVDAPRRVSVFRSLPEVISWLATAWLLWYE